MLLLFFYITRSGENKERCINIKFELLSDTAKMPVKAHETDAAFDLYADEDVVVPAGGAVNLTTNVTWEPSEKLCYMQIKGRSGLAFKSGIEASSAGVIDSDYRGAIGVRLINTTKEDFKISKGDRCAQGVVIPLVRTKAKLGAVNHDTCRGKSGFGSSGVK